MWHTLMVVSMTAATGLHIVMGTSSQSSTGGTSSSYASTASEESRQQLQSMSDYRRAVIEYLKDNPGNGTLGTSIENIVLGDENKLPWRNFRDQNGLVYIYVADGKTVADDLYQLLLEKTYNSALVGNGATGFTPIPASLNGSREPGTPFWVSNTAVLASPSDSGAEGSNGLALKGINRDY